VQFSRVALPEQAGTCYPPNHLSSPMRERVEREDTLLPEPARPARSLDPRNMIERAEELQLARAILSIGMGRWCAEESLMQDLTGKVVCGGWFCVESKTDVDRLIFDRRPENEFEERLLGPGFPSASCFNGMVVPRGHGVRVSVDDLKVYYYTLERRPKQGRNCVGSSFAYEELSQALPAELLPDEALSPSGHFRIQLLVHGMGDKNASDVGQGTHVGMLRQGGCMLPSESIFYKHPPPRGLYLGGGVSR